MLVGFSQGLYKSLEDRLILTDSLVALVRLVEELQNLQRELPVRKQFAEGQREQQRGPIGLLLLGLKRQALSHLVEVLQQYLLLQAEGLVIVQLQDDIVALLQRRGAYLRRRILPCDLRLGVNILVREEVHVEELLRRDVRVEVARRTALELLELGEGVQSWLDVELHGVMMEEELGVEQAELPELHWQVLGDLVGVQESAGPLDQLDVQLRLGFGWR